MDFKEEFEKLVAQKEYEAARIVLEQNHIHALEDPFYYANMGWIMNQLERYDEAILCLRKGLNLFSGDGWMYSQIAYAYDRQGHLEEGLRAIEEAFSLGFQESWLYGEKGWCYKELKDYEKAIVCFEDALMEDEDNVWLLSQAAFTYVELKDIESAENYFLKCYRLQPNDDSLYDLVNFYKQCNEYRKIIAYLDYDRPSEYEAWRCFELGSAYHECKEEEKALEQLQKSLLHGRDDTGIRTLLGDVYGVLQENEKRDEQYQLALDYYEKALANEETSDREWIWQEMIWISHKQRKYVEELAYLDRASIEYPDNLWMKYHYARGYSDLDDHKNAIVACEECIRLGEDSKEMYDLYAWNLGRSEREQEAIAQLEKRMELYGEEEWCFGELGWNYALLKDYDKSLTAYEKASSYSPDHYQHISMIGWCYLRKQDYETALSYILKAKELGREDGWLHSVLGELYCAMNRISESLSEYETAFSLGFDEEWMHDEVKQLKEKLNKESQQG